MPEFAKSDQASKGGRRPFVPDSNKQRDRVALLAAGGIPQPKHRRDDQAFCERTLRDHFGAELEVGRGVKRAENFSKGSRRRRRRAASAR